LVILTGEDMPLEMFISGERLAAIRAKHHFGGESVRTRVVDSTNSSEAREKEVFANERKMVSRKEEPKEAGCCCKADQRAITTVVGLILLVGDKAGVIKTIEAWRAWRFRKKMRYFESQLKS
jgi:hypothetical protein